MNKEIITFQVTDPLLKRLNQVAKDMELSRSDIIRMAIKEYISNLEKSIHQEYKNFL
jgi:metal-responsive CopG/Arc/MetJ family transcriptional regulator